MNKGLTRLRAISSTGRLRLSRGKDTRRDSVAYVAKAKTSITLKAAATAWANGVPWAEALDIAGKAMANVAAKVKPAPRGRRGQR